MTNTTTSTTLQLRRRKALADALAGVVATLVSLWTFYPIDVLKTKLQAGVDHNSKQPPSNLIATLFRGLSLKTLHAASSSFTYFYIYSFIASWWTQRAGKKDMSPAVRLSLSAIAAMMNTFVTLPLDVLASKQQAAHHENDKENDATQDESLSSEESLEQMQQQEQILKMDRVWNSLDPNTHDNDIGLEERGGEVFYDSCSEVQPVPSRDSSDEEGKEAEKDGWTKPRVKVTVTTSVQRGKKQLKLKPNPKLMARQNSTFSKALAELPSFWKGLCPSLLLCSNPSIHYTVFDMTKAYLIKTKSTSTDNLTMAEAFLLGLFAKFCATMATYPLIRAKVMLMVTSRTSMLRTLLENYQREGVAKGLYKGCSVQLLHTVLKSALLMMVKERIERTTRRMLLPTNSTVGVVQSK